MTRVMFMGSTLPADGQFLWMDGEQARYAE